MELNYTKVGDYLLPNLTIKEHKKGLYTTLLMQDKLTSHLVSVSNDCEERLKILMDNYRESDEKLSERNKEINQFEWVKLMNNYKDCAEEIILKEMIYV